MLWETHGLYSIDITRLCGFSPLQDPLTEHAAYEQMALFASACAFSWSKWNAKCGAEHLVLQVFSLTHTVDTMLDLFNLVFTSFSFQCGQFPMNYSPCCCYVPLLARGGCRQSLVCSGTHGPTTVCKGSFQPLPRWHSDKQSGVVKTAIMLHRSHKLTVSLRFSYRK